MTATKGTGSKADSNMREAAQKEWRRPSLRKLPIAATASGKPRWADEGNTKKTAGRPVDLVESAYNCSRCQSSIVLE